MRVRDEPYHPQRHQLGLARAGAGHDQQRLAGRCADHGELFIAEVVPEPEAAPQLVSGEPGSARDGRPHAPVTCRPFPETGPAVRTGQYPHESLPTAGKVAAAIAAAARSTSAAAHPRSGASESGACTRTAALA